MSDANTFPNPFSSGWPGISGSAASSFQALNSGILTQQTSSVTGSSSASVTPTALRTTSTTQHKANVGPVVGGVVGGLIVLGVLGAAYLYLRRRRSRRRIGDAIRTSVAGEKPDLASDESQNLTSDAQEHVIEPFTAGGLYSDSGQSSSNANTSAAPFVQPPGPHSSSSAKPVPTIRGHVASSSQPSGEGKSEKALSKVAEKRKELSRMMAEREESLTLLQRERSLRSTEPNPFSAPGDMTVIAESHPQSTTSNDNEDDLRRQMRQLQEEMERMRGQLSVLQDEPPPVYE
ncbi:hypothetical protein NEOLEDRAFT_582052 [Neolentinus lepideus HHB14362 ss-1]|uniref:Uncharacterized protein n=1 Tax=Neolentinus lepideus HHB14362 ss-1 TaxID=1314782 RepID=A0A165QYB8_9AGAM|nr:hypothetical protein NEOLEDRAFT_582052 [Neolentinus lepideus HHB14362 ss-1]